MNRFHRLINKPFNLYSRANSGGGVIIKQLYRFYYLLLSRYIRWYYHCDIPYTLDVSGCYFCHKAFGVVINPHTVFGRNVVIQHSVTIGEIGDGVPTIGDNVYIGARVIVIGGIMIGDNVKIGAGTVVTKDIPAGCTVVGVPARIIIKESHERT